MEAQMNPGNNLPAERDPTDAEIKRAASGRQSDQQEGDPESSGEAFADGIIADLGDQSQMGKVEPFDDQGSGEHYSLPFGD